MKIEECFASNLRFLRKKHNLTQDELATRIGANRSVIGSYEEGRATPKLGAIMQLSALFRVRIDELVSVDLSVTPDDLLKSFRPRMQGTELRVLTTVVNDQNREQVTLVPVQASAGYLDGYADLEFVEQLPAFQLPVAEMSAERTYRMFQIKGDSMLPIPSGAYIVSEYVDNWLSIRDGQTYVVLTQTEGVVFKRLYSNVDEDGTFLFVSDNPLYDPYTVKVDDIVEVWKAKGVLSFSLDNAVSEEMSSLKAQIAKLTADVEKLKGSLPA
ncbi:XRE family transcriptional regulator [Alistipes sp. ZOR0009]|jgi:transcriptional regulator with XRE-family HTH domain|uniref:XRE family transcriptional regulator n=1 Tax=Alistipes sp. ZOR0009 TaxID=1339253 RepID=UPI000646355D|nr:XRE family transcriptional regulator [Alistipes sp. ZOR0009]